MPIDLTKLSDEELDALSKNDFTKLSDETLNLLAESGKQERLAAERTPGIPSVMYEGEINPLLYDMPPTPESQHQAAIIGSRYIAPIAATVGTGGVGAVPAIAGAVTSAVGETAAQLLEGRPELSEREIGAAFIAGGAPVFQAAPAKAGVKTVLSPAAKSFLATTGSQIAASEASRYVRAGEFEPLGGEGFLGNTKEAVKRWGLQVAAGYMAGKASQFAEGGERLQQLKATRGGGNVMLSEIAPKYTQLEANQIASGNRLARNLAENLDVNMADVIRNAYGNLPPQSQSAIAQDLVPYVNALEESRAALQQAQQASKAADDAFKAAKLNRSADLSKIKDAARVAEENRLLQENNLQTMLDDVFGNKTPIFTDQVSWGALGRRMKANLDVAKEGSESALTALYADAGIGVNDVVVRKEDVLRSINARTFSGRALEGERAQDEARKAVELFFGENPTATLEEFRNFKNKIAENLPGDARPDQASRYAGAIYNSLKNASYKYIGEALGPEALRSFKRAQSSAASMIQKGETDAIQLLKDGKFEDFYKAAKNEGKLGVMMSQLDSYAKSLASTTRRAVESGQLGTATGMENVRLAMDFKRDVNSVILNGIINESIPSRSVGRAALTDVVDPQKLIQNLGYFESQGFSLGQLGVDRKAVSDMIKANAMVGKEPLTVGKLNDFLALLPSTSSDVAAARIAYREAVANGMIAQGAKEKTEAFSKAKKIADGAKLDEAARQAEYTAASNNPLTQFFNENGTMLLNKGALQNSDWVESILTKDPKTIRSFVDALKAPIDGGPGRLDVLDKMREAAVAFAVKRFMPSSGAGTERLNVKEIANIFTSSNREMQMQRDNLRAILGDQSYDRMMQTVVDPLIEIAKTKQKLASAIPTTKLTDDVRGLLSIEGLAEGRSTGATLKTTAVKNALNLISGKYYGTVAGIWLNPEFAQDLSKAGYNLERFAQMSSRNRTAVDIYTKSDEDAKRNQPTP